MADSAPAIEMRSIVFSWQTNNEPLFPGISFSVVPGSQLAIVGPNGCGKSTLLSITLGALRPDEGEVLIGNMPANEYVNSYSDSIAFVGAEPFLIYDSIRENLTYGLSGDCGDDELWRVLDDVGLAAFVRGLPRVFDHIAMENGDGLSTGQKQRISIARALLRKPRLLALDEPFANLDLDSALRIAGKLRAMKNICTVLLVSHDSRMFSAADAVLDLNSAEAQRMAKV